MKYDVTGVNAEKQKIQDTIAKRKITATSRNTPTKTKDEKLVTQHIKATGADEPANRLTLDAQIDVVRSKIEITGISQLLKVSLDTASKISIDEIDFEYIDSYHAMLEVVDKVFDRTTKTYTTKQIATTIEVLVKYSSSTVDVSVPVELTYALQLHGAYSINTLGKKKALIDLIATTFPDMKPSNREAILKSR